MNCTEPLIWFSSVQFMNHEHGIEMRDIAEKAIYAKSIN
jgi:hypothetical protein